MECEIIEIGDTEMEDIKKKLFYCAMGSDWEEVVRICKKHPSSHKAIIPASGETILYMAVSDRQEEIVALLVEQMSEPDLDALKIGNDAGDSPLHLAASIGNVPMCKSITVKDKKLLGVRNRKGETPLFLAAHHGQKEAFLFLHLLCGSYEGYRYCRKDDGKTILHCAIAGEHFDLAILIILLYKDLAHWVDEKGISPLHLLASKPTAFRSGISLIWIERIVYHWVSVEDLNEDELLQQSTESSESKKKIQYPENYRTCMNFWKTIKTAATTVFRPFCQDEDAKNPKGHRSISRAQRQMFPPNYDIFFEFLKFANTVLLVFLGIGFGEIKKTKDKKEKHSRSMQLLEKLLQCASMHDYYSNGEDPRQLSLHKDEETILYNNFKEISTPILSSNQTQPKELRKSETPILIAAGNGVTEMVEKILQFFPVAIHDRNSEKKNVVLLAVENRQPEVYELLVKRKFRRDSMFLAVDNEGNSALHLAAMLREHRPWHIPGSALQMQWEIKWYKFVKNSMPQRFFIHYNNEHRTPREIFIEDHSDLLKKGGEWLNSTSSSCSVVAALIAAVSFATTSNVPGSFNDSNGRPNFENQSTFHAFAFSSLIALCSSVTSLVMFLAILTSRQEEDDFYKELPRKLLFGLSALFISIAAMLVSFCAGYFYVLGDELNYGAIPTYAVACLPISFFAVAEFPLYVDLMWATFRRVPKPRYKVVF